METAKGTRKEALFKWLRRHGPVLVPYCLLTWFTGPLLMGDTVVYVDSILAHKRGGAADLINPFWDFGHLLWRPLGWLFFSALRPIFAAIAGTGDRSQVAEALIVLSWIAGFVAVLLVRDLASKLTKREWVATLVTGVLVTSYGFINYVQTGTAYVPGLTLLLLSVWTLLREPNQASARKTTIMIAALGLAGSVCLWLPYIVAVPAALAAPIFVHGLEKARMRTAATTAIAAAALIALAYGLVILVLGLHDIAGIKEWMTASSHGYRQTGILRSLFGFARSFINMGNDGVLFKRYLLRDPYNHVSLLDLFRLSLWKFGFFYVFVMWMSIRLLLTQAGRRIIGLLAVAAIPVFIFAMFVFEGGLPERYLAFLPFFLLALLYALETKHVQKAFACTVGVFIVVMIISDVEAMGNRVLERQQEGVMARIADLQPQLKPRSLIATVHLQDELANFSFTFPFHPLNQRGHLRVYSVLEPGADRISTWREDFASNALASWSSGGDVWVSKRFFHSRPRPEWNWVEGDDKRISWADLQPFFAQFQFGAAVGNDDGFVMLLRSAHNEDLLRRFAGTP